MGKLELQRIRLILVPLKLAASWLMIRGSSFIWVLLFSCFLTGCHVEIENGEGSAYEFLEEGPGEYQGLSLVHFLKAGEAYRLLVVPPDRRNSFQI